MVGQSEVLYSRIMRQARNEDMVEYTTYGIMAQPVDDLEQTLVIHDISSFSQNVDRMVERFNEHHLLLEHFCDAVNDFVVEMRE